MADDIKKALNISYDLHKGQIRKIDKSPYIIHPLEVFSFVSRFTSDTDTLVASLLHDTLEDTEYTKEQLKEDFNENVLELVSLVTEDKSLTWQERKDAYIKTLAESKNKDAILVSAADKINNLDSMLDTHEKIGSKIWSMFNAPFFRQIEFYDSYYENLNKFLPEEIKTKLSDRIEKLRTFKDEQGPIIEPIFGHGEYDYDDVTMQMYSEDFFKRIDKKFGIK